VRSAACFEVVGQAASGERAVALAARLLPDLVLMDVAMPGIGGIDAARRIAELCPATLTVLLSTYPESDLPAAVRSCGAAAYVDKADFAAAVLDRLWARERQAPCAAR
jgi:DNA-binding NarL/FixJ family response regulator